MAPDSATLILAIALLAASICAQRPLFIDDIDDLVEDVLSEVLDIQVLISQWRENVSERTQA